MADQIRIILNNKRKPSLELETIKQHAQQYITAQELALKGSPDINKHTLYTEQVEEDPVTDTQEQSHNETYQELQEPTPIPKIIGCSKHTKKKYRGTTYLEFENINPENRAFINKTQENKLTPIIIQQIDSIINDRIDSNTTMEAVNLHWSPNYLKST